MGRLGSPKHIPADTQRVFKLDLAARKRMGRPSGGDQQENPMGRALTIRALAFNPSPTIPH